MEKIRLLFADDHPLFRDGIRTLLTSSTDIEIVGEMSTGEEAVQAVGELLPDVILMDLSMTGMSGIEATRHILQAHPQIGILVLTMFDDDDSVFAAMRAGAKGYLLKGVNHEETLRAIRAVASGEAIFSPSIAGRLMHYFSRLHRLNSNQVFPELTERELEVLTLLSRGVNNTDIAQQLFLSPKTVRNHVSNIFNKLQVADRAQAITRARDAGLK